MSETDVERAKANAKAGLESIVAMVKRLKHADECDGGEDCELDDQEILGGINIYYTEGMKASADDKTQYHDSEEARQAIQEDPLSVEVRSGWHAPGENSEPDEYNILLGTGGPALAHHWRLGPRHADHGQIGIPGLVHTMDSIYRNHQ